MAIAGGNELGLVLLVLLVASTVHASFGFGTALVAMPLLVLLLGLSLATPLVGLAGLTTVTVVLYREWRVIDWTAAWRLLLASVLGIPCGLWLLKFAPSDTLKACLGAVLLSYSVFNLARPVLPRLRSPLVVYVCGFVAGVLGGAYNTNGPPVVLYGALAQWPPAQFRATLQGYFFPAAILICVAHAVSGLWSAKVFVMYGYALPVLLLGNFCGAQLAKRIDAARFTRILYGLLAALGALMFI